MCVRENDTLRGATFILDTAITNASQKLKHSMLNDYVFRDIEQVWFEDG